MAEHLYPLLAGRDAFKTAIIRERFAQGPPPPITLTSCRAEVGRGLDPGLV